MTGHSGFALLPRELEQKLEEEYQLDLHAFPE